MKKRLFAFLLAVVTVATLTTHAFALEGQDTPSSPANVHDDVLVSDASNGPISPRVTCDSCGVGLCFTICYNNIFDQRTVVDTWSHTYGGGKTCWVTMWGAEGAYMCELCGYVRPLEDYIGLHNCVEEHVSCGKDEVYWCPMGDFSLPGWA